jgi:hypothetical protein
MPCGTNVLIKRMLYTGSFFPLDDFLEINESILWIFLLPWADFLDKNDYISGDISSFLADFLDIIRNYVLYVGPPGITGRQEVRKLQVVVR